MPEPTAHTVTSTPQLSSGLLQSTINELGYIPPQMITMADSPVALEAYQKRTAPLIAGISDDKHTDLNPSINHR